MNIKPVNDAISVSEQILVTDIATIAHQGFKSIICNRPDNEQAEQVNFAVIEQAAMKAGLRCEFLPVVNGKISQHDATQFAKLVKLLPSPVLAYCRTGNRSITLWAMANKDNIGEAAVIDTVQSAGYDVNVVLSALSAAK